MLAECIAGTEQAFTEQMNALAKQLGITNSHFGTANGWPDNGVTYVTARDLATLARRHDREPSTALQEILFAPELHLGEDAGSGQDITQANRNPILGHVPGADGLKTGHTDEAGYGFTGSAEQNGRRLIEVLAGLPSWNARVQESTRLIEWGFNAWPDKPLFNGRREGRLGAGAARQLERGPARRPAQPRGHRSRRAVDRRDQR